MFDAVFEGLYLCVGSLDLVAESLHLCYLILELFVGEWDGETRVGVGFAETCEG